VRLGCVQPQRDQDRRTVQLTPATTRQATPRTPDSPRPNTRSWPKPIARHHSSQRRRLTISGASSYAERYIAEIGHDVVPRPLGSPCRLTACHFRVWLGRGLLNATAGRQIGCFNLQPGSDPTIHLGVRTGAAAAILPFGMVQHNDDDVIRFDFVTTATPAIIEGLCSDPSPDELIHLDNIEVKVRHDEILGTESPWLR